MPYLRPVKLNMTRKPREDHSANTYPASHSKNLLLRLQQFIPDSSRLFERFMENSPAQAWVCSADCVLFYMNRSYRTTFDIGDEWLMKRPEFFPPEYLRLYEENNRRVIKENRPIESHEDGLDSQGRYRVFKVCKFPLGTENGVELVGGWMVDVTELRQTSERYEYALKATSDVIWEWDIQKNQVFTENGYEGVLGLNLARDQRTAENYIHKDDVTRVERGICELLQSPEEHWQMEYRYVQSDGNTRHVINKAFVVREKDQKPTRLIGALQDVTKLRKLEQKMHEDQISVRKKLVRMVIQAQEKERNEIGKELHDNISQLLATSKLMIEVARQSPDKTAEILDQCSTLISSAIRENRILSHRLIAPSMDAADFCESISMLADMLNTSGQMNVTVTLPQIDEVNMLQEELRLNLYRIIQEQVSNVLKHSNARNVHLKVYICAGQVNIRISDDGKGFDPNVKTDGVGLRNIRSRVEMFNGSTCINAAPGKGFELAIAISLEEG
jgi:two-component system sensor histidine kinase UhpB